MPPSDLKPGEAPDGAGPASDTPPFAADSLPRAPTPREVQALPQSERYEIQAVVGSGGMGKVYKAFDRKLKRLVALKFLRGADPGLEKRFLQEAQAQARVDHPNVCKVYEVGRIGDEPYIAMQYIEGRTLREAARDLGLRQKLVVLRDVSLAVHAAHRLGLVHRDIKPANIIIEERPEGARPFVTDFGLARDLESPGDTVQGALLGTPQYMAPEQANGELHKLDARTDVYGLGATLYEALTLRPPFDGATQLQTLYRMLHEEPAPPRSLVPDLPQDVESVALKCLEKDPDRRYPGADALAEELQRLVDGDPVHARPVTGVRRLARKLRRNARVLYVALSLAAVPLALLAWTLLHRPPPLVVAVADFDNQTGDEGLDGLSGMLITSLEQSQRLSVLTRSRMLDVLRQLGHGEAARIDESLGREVAQKAAAQALLLATIHRFDQLYVIDLKILDPRSNQYVAALEEKGSGKESVPPLIDKLSAAARLALKDKAPDPRAPVEDLTTSNLEAYQHYFRGQEAVDHLQFARAVDQFRSALDIDQRFALAWYGLAYAYMWEHDGPRAREAIDRALAGKLPEKERLLARGVRGSVFARGQEAYEAYKECAKRWPSEKECGFMLGDVIFHAGYMKYAIPDFLAALRLDPSMERAHQHLTWAYQLTGEGASMLAAAREYVRAVNDAESWGTLGRAQASLGSLAEARDTFERAAQLFPASPIPRADLAALQAWEQDVDGAEARLAPLLDRERPVRDRLLGHMTMGGVLVQGGRARAAAAAFEHAAADAREAQDGEAEAVALAADALVRFLYLRDAEGARRIARDAVARGVPETMFAFVYPLLGDVDAYARTLQSAGDPLAADSVEVFRRRAAGDWAGAAGQLKKIEDKSPYRDFLTYVLADCWMNANQDRKAIDALQRAQATFPGVGAPGPGYGGMFRARADGQLAALYERTGSVTLALQATRRFLTAWARADADLPELKEARARLARLQSGANPPPR
jgi:tetratricopeptide (TPR) repeat protein/predicted Ser/Thr protein kinase